MLNKLFKTPLSLKDYVIFLLIPLLTVVTGYINGIIIVPWYVSYKEGLEIGIFAIIFLLAIYALLRLIGRAILSQYHILIKIGLSLLSFAFPFVLILIALVFLLFTDMFFEGQKVTKLNNSVFYYYDSFDGYASCHYYYRHKKSIFLKKVYTENLESEEAETCSCKQIDKQNIKLGKKGVFIVNTLKTKEN